MEYRENIRKKIENITAKRNMLAKHLNLDGISSLENLIGQETAFIPKKYPDYNFDINIIPDFEGEEVLRGSKPFLKGTITGNPQNDYSQNFVDVGERPQNFIMDIGMDARYAEYPKLRELMRLKDELTLQRALPPLSVKANLRDFDLKSLKNVFDVILIQPPLKEYLNFYPSLSKTVDLWDWDECFYNWGFRRCEDICWVKTNQKSRNIEAQTREGSLFLHTKEHLLMGIKGSIKRNSDYEFIHSNVDLDVIVTEEPVPGCLTKPEEVFYIIEHFCMSRKRIHIFGDENDLRPGWLTLGPNVFRSNFEPEPYAIEMNGDRAFLGKSMEIEALRPKSPSQRPAYQGNIPTVPSNVLP